MKLYRLARLEILVIQKELKEKRAEQKRLKELLGSDRSRWAVVRDELAEIEKPTATSGAPRIGGAGSEELEFSEEAFIADEDANVVLTRDGWVKRVRELKDPLADPRARGRRGGVRARRVAQVEPGVLQQLRHRLRDALQRRAAPPPATATRCRSCSSSTTASGWWARSRWMRGCRRPEKLLAVSRARLRPALRARAAHRGVHPRRPPVRASRARATRSSACVPVPTRTCSR